MPITDRVPRDDARRQQGQLVGLVADDQRMAGIVPALEAHDDVGPVGEPIDDLALALVTPLGADDGDVRQNRSFFQGGTGCLGVAAAPVQLPDFNMTHLLF